jgi:trk system potassium uptake protein TrkA
MRIAFIGAGALVTTAARLLLQEGHEVVIVHPDRQRLDVIAESVDCGLIEGDGSRPAVLREIGPSATDFLFCLSEVDQDNILAGLVGKSLEFGRVVVKIDDPDFEPICRELGLEEILIPSQEAANGLLDRVRGMRSVDLSALVNGGLRFFSFVVQADRAGPTSQLDLPANTRVIAVSRGGRSHTLAEDDALEEKDEVYLVTDREHLDALRKRFDAGD